MAGKKSNRYFKIALASILAVDIGLIGYLGMEMHSYNKFVRKHKAEYGTLKNPKFRIVHNTNVDFDTNMSRHNKFLGLYYEQSAYLSQVERQTESLEKILETVNPDYAGAYVNEAALMGRSIQSHAKNLRFKYDMLFLAFSDEVMQENYMVYTSRQKSYREEIKKYGPPVELAKKIFRKVTGKAVPESLKFVEAKLKNKHGAHSFIQERIEYSDGGYAVTLLTLLHELGHAAYLGYEDEMNRYGFFERMIKQVNPDLRIFEEAAAYLFEINGTAEVMDLFPELGSKMKTHIMTEKRLFIEDYIRGTYSPASIGNALADVLQDYCNEDYVEAFNYVSSRNAYEKVDRQVIQDLESYASRYEKIWSTQDSLMHRWNKASTRLRKVYDAFLRIHEKRMKENK